MKIERSHIISFLIGIGVVLFVLVLDNLTIFLNGLELKTVDTRFYFSDRPQTAQNYLKKRRADRINRKYREKGEGIRHEISKNPRVDEHIMLVGFDEKSITRLGRFPWRRDRYTRFLKNLQGADIGTIYFDVFLPERQTDYPQDDVELGKMCEKLGNVVWDFYFLKEVQEDIVQKQKNISKAEQIHPRFSDIIRDVNVRKVKRDRKSMIDSVNRTAFPRDALIESEVKPETEFPSIKPSVPEIADGAYAQAFCNVMPDSDLVKRKMPIITYHDGRFYPNVDLVIAMRHLKVDPDTVKIKLGEYVLLPNARVYDYDKHGYAKVDPNTGQIKYYRQDIRIPINERGQMMINFVGGEFSYPYRSFVDFFRKGMINVLHKGNDFAGKILYIGAYASQGIADDKHVSPFGDMFGLETHANTLNTIITRRFIRHVPSWVTIVTILVLGLLLSLAVPQLKIWQAAILGVVLFLAYSIAVIYIFDQYRLLLTYMSPVATIAMTFTAIILYRVLIEERNKRFLKSAFAQYISPELIDEMYETKTQPALGGEAKVCTAYFTDIAGFSTFSEKLTAPQLVELLNDYLSGMTDILLSESGTLDKYEGDAIIAFLGAPMELPDHAYRACKVAIGMQNKLLELREKWAQEKEYPGENRNVKDYPPEVWQPGARWPNIVYTMMMRIGINTGEIVVGNMGSEIRKNYTMMGDSVNLAARLEAGAKQYGVYTMMSGSTYNSEFEKDGQMVKLSELIEVRFIDNITVVGKSEPVKVYELISLKGEMTDQEQRLVTVFNEGIAEYLRMNWDAAIAKFEESKPIERFPDAKTSPSEVFIERCQLYKENPPVAAGEQWDGVFRLTSK